MKLTLKIQTFISFLLCHYKECFQSVFKKKKNSLENVFNNTTTLNAKSLIVILE